jgi:hypothetical protein
MNPTENDRRTHESITGETRRRWDWLTLAIMLLGIVLALGAVSELWRWHPWG